MIALILLLFAPLATTICYYPDKSIAAHDTPCHSSDGDSFCCGQGFACLSNKLCQATSLIVHGSSYARGSCTDQTWRSSNCPSFCLGRFTPPSTVKYWHRLTCLDIANGGEGVDQCPTPNTDSYCCHDDLANCNCTSRYGTLFSGSEPATVLQTIGVVDTSSTSLAATSTASTPLTSSASSLGTPAPSTSAGPNSPPEPPSSPNAAVPVGVAVPLGVLTLAALSFFLCRRRKKTTEDMAARSGVYRSTNNDLDPRQLPIDMTKSSAPDYRPREL